MTRRFKSLTYDQLGDIVTKNDVGTYSYPTAGSARPHAVSSITGTVNGVTNPSYSYDDNGNLTSGAGRTLTYTAFNSTASLVQGSSALCLFYDSNHARIKMEARSTSCSGSVTERNSYDAWGRRRKNGGTDTCGVRWSERRDLNPRPPVPQI